MIKEDYVSFEVAKLLKEKGFDEECRAYYVKSKECGIELFPSDRSHNYNDDVYPRTSAPTLQMAMKWLREKHNIHIELGVLKPYGTDEHRHATPKEDVTYHAEIFHINEWNKYLEEFKHVGISRIGAHEEACEAAIKYCLENLI